MNIPIVQGVSVPSGGDGYQNVGDGGMYNNNAFNTSDNNVYGKPEQQPKEWRDVAWAIAFYAHLAVMMVLIVSNAGNFVGDGQANSSSSGILWLVGFCALIAIGISSAALSFMMAFAETLVKMSLIFSVAMSGVIAVLGLLSGQILMGILGLVMFAVGICYARAVWDRIPFAAANLNTALTAVKANMGLIFVAYVMVLLATGWTMIWFVGVGTYVSSENAAVVFCLLVSYYWVHQVLQNTVHVTTAGTVGTWWFVPAEASGGCCNRAIQDSYCRATTFSFGSICLGSLLVAVVQALRAMAHMARQNDDCNMLACILDCILGCIEGIIEYLNKWAYVYVGLYGFGYIEAGRNVIQLFEQKGWTVIITDDLADNVLFMMSVGVGLITGLIGMIAAITDPNLLAGLELANGGTGTAGFLIGLVVGFAFCSILMSVVASAVNTVIVCYAESPAEFQQNHPELSAKMRSAWIQAWPGLVG